jgi:hypothetical protein
VGLHAGYPKLDVTHVWNERTKTLRMTVNQIQKVDKITPGAFRLPMEVEFTTPDGKKTEPLEVAKRTGIFTFKLPAKPTLIKIDPEEKVPLKSVKMEPK